MTRGPCSDPQLLIAPTKSDLNPHLLHPRESSVVHMHWIPAGMLYDYKKRKDNFNHLYKKYTQRLQDVVCTRYACELYVVSSWVRQPEDLQIFLLSASDSGDINDNARPVTTNVVYRGALRLFQRM